MQAYEYLKHEKPEGNVIEVYNVRRKFCRGPQVFKGLEMEVPYGNIYVLVGPSGCGKTTLLRSILGQVKVTSGYVRIFDKAPGAKGNTVPGADVGYMPQLLGMSSEFTIKEIFYYFGSLCKMYRWRVKERIEFFYQMFDFPKGRVKIKRLSFDMQRRLSFAVTLVHEPKLAILDEPTLGIDPVYAEKIWSHLKELTKRTYKTFLIATKCVEQAAMADMVAFMHEGVLLAQSTPQDIMKSYGASSIGEAYHQVYTKHKEGTLAKMVDMPDNEMSSTEFAKKMEQKGFSELAESGEPGDNESSFIFHYDGDEWEEESTCQKLIGSCFPGMQDVFTCNFGCWVPNLCNVFNLFLKSLRNTARNLRNLLSLFIIPLIQLYFISNAAGRLPNKLKVGFINDDVPAENVAMCSQMEVNFGELFRDGLTLNDTFTLVTYGSLDEGKTGVENGDIWMAVYIPRGFSTYLAQNMTTGFNAFSTTLDPPNDTLIELYADLTVPQISSVLQYQVDLAEDEFHNQMMDLCGVAPITPVNLDFVDPPVYGSVTLSPMDYITPSLLLIIVFVQAAAVVSATLTKEMSEGFTERSIVANANLTEMVLALFILEFVILFIQILELFLLMIYGLDVYFVDSSGIPLAAFLTFLTGYSGLAFGLMVASLTSDEKNSSRIISTVLFVLILFSGLIRPLEGANIVIQIFEYMLPTSFGVKAIRSIAERGWGLEQPTVYLGFAMTEMWFVFLLTLAILGFKIRK